MIPQDLIGGNANKSVLAAETGKNYLLHTEDSRLFNPATDLIKLRRSLGEPAARKVNGSRQQTKDPWTAQKPPANTADRSRPDYPSSKETGGNGKLWTDPQQDDASNLLRDAKKTPTSIRNERISYVSETSSIKTKDRRKSVPKQPLDLQPHASKGGRRPDIAILTDNDEGQLKSKDAPIRAPKTPPTGKQVSIRAAGKKVYLKGESNPLDESHNREAYRSSDVQSSLLSGVKVND